MISCHPLSQGNFLPVFTTLCNVSSLLDLAAIVVSYGLVLQDCVQLNQYKLKDEIGKVRCILCMRVCV